MSLKSSIKRAGRPRRSRVPVALRSGAVRRLRHACDDPRRLRGCATHLDRDSPRPLTSPIPIPGSFVWPLTIGDVGIAHVLVLLGRRVLSRRIRFVLHRSLVHGHWYPGLTGANRAVIRPVTSRQDPGRSCRLGVSAPTFRRGDADPLGVRREREGCCGGIPSFGVNSSGEQFQLSLENRSSFPRSDLDEVV